ALERRLGVPVVTTVGRRGAGTAELRAAIGRVAARPRPQGATLNYGPLEDEVVALQGALAATGELAHAIPPRWLAVKLLEDDPEAAHRLAAHVDNPHGLLDHAHRARTSFAEVHGLAAGDHVARTRDQLAGEVVATTVVDHQRGRVPLSERIDRFLLHRWLAPVFLALTIWAVYQLSIVQGYRLTEVTWPLLAEFRSLAAAWLPDPGFLHDPQARSLGLWMVDSVNTLLNYVPIFLILFALIAILEDSGYMARIALILDRVLHRFGLHGQSTLPFVLAGVFAGGCAVPGVMATKGIPDHRARMATILTVPFMNCMAKIPLYTLLIAIYFPNDKALVLFYLSTITVFAALLVAKLLTVTLLRGHETAPFVMELPRYHLPTLKGVLRRALERTWLYIRKVGTVVVAVAAVVYVLLQFPGIAPERQAHYQERAEAAIADFYTALEGNPLRAAVDEPDRLVELVNVYTSFSSARLNVRSREAATRLAERYEERHPEFWPFLSPPREPEQRAAVGALRQLATTRKTLRREMREERIENSFLGHIGRAMEPATQFADFDWKINVALLSSFAARESSVATLGVLFDQGDGENQQLEERMGAEQREAGRTAITAVALMLFFALYPPCLATTIMVRVQTGSYAWMAFSIIFPTILGLTVASLVFTAGTALGLTGLETMSLVYFSALALLLTVGLAGRRLTAMPAPATLEKRA
ncbi:MAG: nucleoside recognition domain-containing protein, partial [Alphaproteobacteria bacterium]